MRRKPRYSVEVAFANNNLTVFGKTESPRIMAFDDVDICLKMLDPTKYTEWISGVRSIPRGGYYKIQVVSNTPDYGQILKQITITRG